MKGRLVAKKGIAVSKAKVQPAPELKRGKFVLAILLAIVSIAIAVIYIRNWPVMNASSTAINLSGTGVPPDVAAAINRGREQVAPAPMPITPATADVYAGVSRESRSVGCGIAGFTGIKLPEF